MPLFFTYWVIKNYIRFISLYQGHSQSAEGHQPLYGVKLGCDKPAPTLVLHT